MRMGDYITKLQARYGDPRVYNSQQQEMRREEAAILHDQGRRKEHQLEDAYKAQVEKNRAIHNQRIKTRFPAQSKHPECQATGRRSRMQKPVQSPPSLHSPDPVSQPGAS